MIKDLLDLANVFKLKNEEDMLHVLCMNYIKANYSKSFSEIRWVHCPSQVFLGNSSARFSYIRKLKGMGWYSGVWDLIVWKLGSSKRLYIEFKSSTGRVSQSQKDFKDWVAEDNTIFIVVKTLKEFQDEIGKFYLES